MCDACVTDCRALVATGSPSGAVSYGGVTHVVAQANNALVFPGLGLIMARASRVTDGMLAAAVAEAAARAAAADGVAGAEQMILPAGSARRCGSRGTRA